MTAVGAERKFDEPAISEKGLGCVKTQRRCDGVERAFHQVSFLVVEISQAYSFSKNART